MTSLGTGLAPIALKPRSVSRRSARGWTVRPPVPRSTAPLLGDIGGTAHANMCALPRQKQGLPAGGGSARPDHCPLRPTSCLGPLRDPARGRRGRAPTGARLEESRLCWIVTRLLLSPPSTAGSSARTIAARPVCCGGSRFNVAGQSDAFVRRQFPGPAAGRRPARRPSASAPRHSAPPSSGHPDPHPPPFPPFLAQEQTGGRWTSTNDLGSHTQPQIERSRVLTVYFACSRTMILVPNTCAWLEYFHLRLYIQIKLKMSTNSQSKDTVQKTRRFARASQETICWNSAPIDLPSSNLGTRSKSSDFIMSHVFVLCSKSYS